MIFKRVFFAVLIVAGILLSCEEESKNEYPSTGVITGPDMGECICCGGYFIEIGDSTYNFETLPDGANIDLSTETFPVSVVLDWTYDKKCGKNQYIEITRIKSD